MALGISVLLASLLGSVHCVSMCGPMAIWLAGTERRWPVIASYHAGRLTTYLSAGLVAGLIGSAVTMTGRLAGFQSAASIVAGVGLIVVGVVQLVRRFSSTSLTSLNVETTRPSWVLKALFAAKPLLAGYGPASRAYIGGLLTTWLPCGWLYLFVMVAAGTGNPVTSLQVMFVFWVGTLPALTGWVLGVQQLGQRFQRVVPVLTSVLLVLAGTYAASGRAAADFSSMHLDASFSQLEEQSVMESTQQLTSEPLPCCREGETP